MRGARRYYGTDYYEHVLLYVDGALCVSEQPEESLKQIDDYFLTKPGAIGPPKIYLGGTISKFNYQMELIIMH